MKRLAVVGAGLHSQAVAHIVRQLEEQGVETSKIEVKRYGANIEWELKPERSKAQWKSEVNRHLRHK